MEKKLIMIIDNSETTRYIIKKMLEKNNFNIVEFGEVKPVLEYLKNRENQFPDLILLDVMLEDYSGDKLFVDIKEIEESAKIILMSTLEISNVNKNYLKRTYQKLTS